MDGGLNRMWVVYSLKNSPSLPGDRIMKTFSFDYIMVSNKHETQKKCIRWLCLYQAPGILKSDDKKQKWRLLWVWDEVEGGSTAGMCRASRRISVCEMKGADASITPLSILKQGL